MFNHQKETTNQRVCMNPKDPTVAQASCSASYLLLAKKTYEGKQLGEEQ